MGTKVIRYGIYYDMTGKQDFKRAKKFPIFIEKYVADAYLKKYVNITGITNFIVRALE
jgi:hypothetical protein